MSIKKTIEIEAIAKDALKQIETLTDKVGNLEEQLKDTNSTSKKVAKGVGAIGNALKAAGIGLAIAAFAKLTEVFNENQKVTDAFSIAFEALSLAFNDFFKFLDANVGTVIDYFKSIFDDPLQSISDFSSAIYDGIVKRLEQGLEALGLFGDAAIKFFAGDFAGAALTAKEASKELFDVVTGEDGGFEKITESVKTAVNGIVDYTNNTVKLAKETVELNKAAEIAAVINQGLIEKYDRQAEQQRQLRDDETKTIDERIEANEKLGEILDEQAEKMLENAAAIEKAAQAQYDKNDSDENFIALQEAKNEAAAIEAQIEGFRSEQLINRISLEREQADAKKEADEAEIERLEELAEKKAETEEKNRQQVYDTLDATIEAAGAETKVGKALFLAKQAILIQEQIMQAKATLQELGLISAKATADTAAGAASTAKVGFPQNVPLLIAFAGQAAGIIMAVKSAVNAAKGSASQMGGGGAGGAASTPQAPSFNIVGAAPENQLAQAIGEQEEKPIKAFVVSNEVTNAQALERNIVEGASIG